MIGVFLDNNIWDLLFERQLDLAIELPRDSFRIGITREAEFEIDAIQSRRPELWAFVCETITRCDIQTDTYFGFAEAASSPEDHRFGGFNSGRWIGNRERAFLEEQRHRRTLTQRPSRLYSHEADISLAARSFDCVVVTRDNAGAFKDASAQGGKLVFLKELNSASPTLRQLIEAAATNV